MKHLPAALIFSIALSSSLMGDPPERAEPNQDRIHAADAPTENAGPGEAAREIQTLRDKQKQQADELARTHSRLQEVERQLQFVRLLLAKEKLMRRNDRAKIEQAEIEARHATQLMLEAQGIAAIRQKEVERLQTEMAITRAELLKKPQQPGTAAEGEKD